LDASDGVPEFVGPAAFDAAGPAVPGAAVVPLGPPPVPAVEALPDGVLAPRVVVTPCAAVTMSLATERPAAIAPLRTFPARFNSPIVSAIADADTLPARSRSSTASVKRVNAFAGFWRSAYLDSRNS